ncbi:unnamed protein product [Lampetra fluviatilis]
MTSEAERMLHKMRGMEVEAQGIHLELRRMEASVSSLRSENELLSHQLRAEQDARAADKRALLAELVAERQRRELGDREATFKEAEVSRARQEQEAALASLRSAEHSVRMLETQASQGDDARPPARRLPPQGPLAQRGEQQRATEAELSERRAQLLRSQATLGTAQEHFLSSSAVLQEQIAREYREESRTLRQQLRERELSGEQERLLRAKVTEDCAALARDNAALRAQTLELSRCLELECSLRDEGASRLSSSASRLLSLQESERSGHSENLRLRQLLEEERKRTLEALQQVLARLTSASGNNEGKSKVNSRWLERETRWPPRRASEAASCSGQVFLRFCVLHDTWPGKTPWHLLSRDGLAQHSPDMAVEKNRSVICLTMPRTPDAFPTVGPLQVHRLEQELSRKELSVAAARSRATELEARHASAHEASVQLRNDKALLVEHIADLQNKASR